MENEKNLNRERAKSRYQNLLEGDKKLYIDNAKKNFKKWVKDNPIRYRFNLAKDRARRKGLEMDIDLKYLEDLFEEQSGKCKYTNVELSQCVDKTISMSIDRIDPTKGYIKGNMAFTSSIVNSMKNDLTEDEFLHVIDLISKYTNRV